MLVSGMKLRVGEKRNVNFPFAKVSTVFLLAVWRLKDALNVDPQLSARGSCSGPEIETVVETPSSVLIVVIATCKRGGSGSGVVC